MWNLNVAKVDRESYQHEAGGNNVEVIVWLVWERGQIELTKKQVTNECKHK